ncbi:MAG: altronate dehydrogenase [Candidatus Hydrogenedentota bacterium]
MSQDVSTILQFGTGRFLRAFIGVFVQEANDVGGGSHGIVAVQSTPGKRADLLNESADGYTIQIRGVVDGETIDRPVQVKCVERALLAAEEWDAVLEAAANPELAFITSNTTEASYALDESDTFDAAPPNSFPAKLALCLRARFDAGLPGATIAPCELVEKNGAVLRALVLEQVAVWNMDAAFVTWLTEECGWLNTMVDRMVVPPYDEDPLAKADPLAAIAEPFSQWIIERVPGREVSFLSHPGIQWVDDVDAMFLRKVRILNGAHTAMVAKYLPLGFETVQEVMQDADARDWVRGLIVEEAIPCIAHRAENCGTFAFQTLDRLANPFFEHRLKDIAMGHDAKVEIRLKSTFDDYVELYGKEPKRVAEAIALSAEVNV